MNDTNMRVMRAVYEAITELDPNRVSWVDKHFVIDLRQKAQVLLEAVSRLEDAEKEHSISAAQKFLTEIEPVIQLLPPKK